MSKPFLRADQGIKVASKPQKSKDQDAQLQFDLWSISDQELQKGMIKQSSTMFGDQKFWSRSQIFNIGNI